MDKKLTEDTTKQDKKVMNNRRKDILDEMTSLGQINVIVVQRLLLVCFCNFDALHSTATLLQV